MGNKPDEEAPLPTHKMLGLLIGWILLQYAGGAFLLGLSLLLPGRITFSQLGTSLRVLLMALGGLGGIGLLLVLFIRKDGHGHKSS